MFFKRRKSESAQQHFNRAAIIQPARMLENAHGFKDIAGVYRFPGGLEAASFENKHAWLFGSGGIQQRPEILQEYPALPEHRVKKSPDEPLKTFLNRLSPEYKGLLAKAWTALEDLNPQLKNVAVDKSDVYELYNSLLGVSSGFNVNDINFYLKLSREGDTPVMQARAMPETGALMKEILEKLDISTFGWVPSKSTLQEMQKQLSQGVNKSRL